MEKRKVIPIFQTVPKDEFTDREDIIQGLYKRAIDTPRGLTRSTAVIGRRRLGKTAVLEEVYNRLFWLQDEVIPIYFNFEGKPDKSTEFAVEYFRNFLVQYTAFRMKNNNLIKEIVNLEQAIELARSLQEEGIESAIKGFLSSYQYNYLHGILETAIWAPRQVMDHHRMYELPKISLFVMLDEFQDVLKIYYSNGSSADTVGLYQWAVEGRLAPHIITGSAVSLITQEVLGTGPLFGRFDFIRFKPLEDIYGAELIKRLSFKYQIEISEELGMHLVKRTDGNPFYISCIMSRAYQKELKKIDGLDSLNNLITYEITQGNIWSNWTGQLQKYFRELNTYWITKEILFYASQSQDDDIDPEEIGRKVGRPTREIFDILTKLALADLIECHSGIVFRNIKDPILQDFIVTQYKQDIVREDPQKIYQELLSKYRALKGKYADLMGQVVESRIEGMINRFNDQVVDGRRFFGVDKEVLLPKFEFVYDTVVKAGTRQYQIDIMGSLVKGEGTFAWIVECKYWDKKIGKDVITKFEEAAQVATETYKIDYPTKWIFSKSGFTRQARQEMERRGMLYSDIDQVNDLLNLFGIERL